MKAYLNSNSPLFSSVKVQVLRVPNIMYQKLRSLMGHMLNLIKKAQCTLVMDIYYVHECKYGSAQFI